MRCAVPAILRTSAAITMPSTATTTIDAAHVMDTAACNKKLLTDPIISPEVNNNKINVPATHGVRTVRIAADSNPYKLVACDMDGTLLSSNHAVSEYTRRVLSQLLARGVHVIFATGRPFTDVHRIKRRLNIFAAKEKIPTPGVQVVTPASGSPFREYPSVDRDLNSLSSTLSSVLNHDHPVTQRVVPRCFAITSNGACIYNETNERVYEKCINPKLCKALYEMYTDDVEVNINVFRGVKEEDRQRSDYSNPSDVGNDHAKEEWVSRYPSDLEAALYHESQFTFKVIPDLESSFPTDHVNEIFFLCYNPEKCAEVEEEIARRVELIRTELRIDESVRIAPSASYCLDIMPTDVSKASALQYVCDQLGIGFTDCIAFGDGLNDVEMLNSVGKGCIMQNGSARLKAKLPHLEVIGCNDEDGVARKLAEVFGLDA